LHMVASDVFHERGEIRAVASLIPQLRVALLSRTSRLLRLMW
jgi:hypothetical protein